MIESIQPKTYPLEDVTTNTYSGIGSDMWNRWKCDLGGCLLDCFYRFFGKSFSNFSFFTALKWNNVCWMKDKFIARGILLRSYMYTSFITGIFEFLMEKCNTKFHLSIYFHFIFFGVLSEKGSFIKKSIIFCCEKLFNIKMDSIFHLDKKNKLEMCQWIFSYFYYNFNINILNVTNVNEKAHISLRNSIEEYSQFSNIIVLYIVRGKLPYSGVSYITCPSLYFDKFIWILIYLKAQCFRCKIK